MSGLVPNRITSTWSGAVAEGAVRPVEAQRADPLDRRQADQVVGAVDRAVSQS